MRKGINPNKHKNKREVFCSHRIISAIYVPSLEGFYVDAIEVLTVFFKSLFLSIDKESAITIIDNGCCIEVKELIGLYSDRIDTIICHSQNIGKIDAQIGAARLSCEPFITLTDSDILFKPGWVENVLSVFNNFPNVGSVSPIPVRKSLWYYTSSVLHKIIFRKIDFNLERIPENTLDYNRYLSSINWDSDENDIWPVVCHKGNKAIVGSGHQILTINRNILFSTVPNTPCLVLVGNLSEEYFIDRSIDMSRQLRLSTYNNWAYHIGNKADEWMNNLLIEFEQHKKALEINICPKLKIEEFNATNKKLRSYSIRKKIMKLIFKIKYHKLDL